MIYPLYYMMDYLLGFYGYIKKRLTVEGLLFLIDIMMNIMSKKLFKIYQIDI